MASTPTTARSSREQDREEKAGAFTEGSRPSSRGEKQTTRDDNTFVDETGSVVVPESRGVTEMAALHARLSTKYRVLLYGGFAILAID